LLTEPITIPGALDTRQLGGIVCNIARFRILKALGDTRDAVDQIQNPAVQAAAVEGLDQASSGINQIATALLTGGTPPAGGRDLVADGLAAVGAALSDGDA
jgi:hypothetical protein